MLVDNYGRVLRISRKQYKNLLESIAKGNGCDLTTVGHDLGPVIYLTDLSPEDAEDILKEFST